jgi:hypothetical protein
MKKAAQLAYAWLLLGERPPGAGILTPCMAGLGPGGAGCPFRNLTFVRYTWQIAPTDGDQRERSSQSVCLERSRRSP